jgi:hypothetical protein
LRPTLVLDNQFLFFHRSNHRTALSFLYTIFWDGFFWGRGKFGQDSPVDERSNRFLCRIGPTSSLHEKQIWLSKFQQPREAHEALTESHQRLQRHKTLRFVHRKVTRNVTERNFRSAQCINVPAEKSIIWID